MKKRNKTTWWVVGVFIAIAALLVIPQLTDPHKEIKAYWAENGVECLSQGHANLAQHIHPHLEIIIDGEEEPVSANIGLVSTCMAEIHTHDTRGEIHIESVDANKEFTLQNFFTVWGKNLEREGYSLNVLVEGESIDNPQDLILEDLQQIEINYISVN
ncbi:MAG: hypothetical protein WD607_11730 [Candidatus Paceibacterota bacterium]